MSDTAGSRTRAFRALLAGPAPVVVPGAYDAMSARLVERAGFAATYVGSFSAAAATYGLPDVGLLTLDEMVGAAGRVAGATTLPVLTDGEAGFYDAPNLWRAIRAFEAAGVVGLHLEDNLGGKHSSRPAGLLPAAAMAAKVRAAVDARTDPDFVVIARSDALWVHEDLADCVDRLERYADAGADMVFAPGLTAGQLSAVRARLPVPVMVLGDLLDRSGSGRPASSIPEYADAGADVVLLFYILLGAAAHGVATALDRLRVQPDVAGLRDLVTDQRTFESSLDYDQFEARSLAYNAGDLV